MTVTSDKVLIAKQDIYAEIDNGYGQKIKQLVAREGQEVPAAFEEYVDSEDVTSELAKTRSLVSHPAAHRRDRVDAERVEPEHTDVRAAAAVTEPVATAAADSELVAENESLREQLAEAQQAQAAAEERVTAAEAATETTTEGDSATETEDTETGDGDGSTSEEGEKVKEPQKDASKARGGAENKARKSAPNKARKSAKTK